MVACCKEIKHPIELKQMCSSEGARDEKLNRKLMEFCINQGHDLSVEVTVHIADLPANNIHTGVNTINRCGQHSNCRLRRVYAARKVFAGHGIKQRLSLGFTQGSFM